MKQLQTVYINQEKFKETLKGWKENISSARGKAIAHIIQRYDAMPEAYLMYREITAVFAEILPEVPYAVFSGAGEIFDQQITDNVFTVTLTIFEDSESDVRIHLFSMSEPIAVAEVLRKQIFRLPELCGVEIISALAPDRLFELLDIMDELPSNVEVFGGVAVSDSSCPPFVAVNSRHSMTDAFILITYSGPRLHIMTKRANGWRPIGFPIRVSKASADVIYTLNDAPAFDVYSHYLKIPNDRNFFYNALEFPFEISEPNGDTYIRHAKSSTGSGAIIMSSYVPEGSTIRLTYGDPDSIMQDVQEEVQHIADFKPDILYICNCLGRKLFWGDDASIDISPFLSLAPMSGGCYLGEILRFNGRTYLNNLSLVVVSMREGEALDYPSFSITDPNARVLSLASRLASFINTMTGELQEANEQLKSLLKQATTDALTELYNRGEIERRINQRNEQLSQDHKPWSLIMMDIDDFKQINDNYSHAEGDNVLKIIAEAVRSLLETAFPEASLGRWGGEEFMILLPESDAKVAAALAETLRLAIAHLRCSSYRNVTMSLGVTEHIPGETVETILNRVDEALYIVKNGGKNAVKVL